MSAEGFLENEFSPRAQFQILTVCVWISDFLLLFAVFNYVRAGHRIDSRCSLPLLHLLPWWIGFIERRRLLKQPPELIATQRYIPLSPQAFTRLLWGAYAALVNIELILFFGW